MSSEGATSRAAASRPSKARSIRRLLWFSRSLIVALLHRARIARAAWVKPWASRSSLSRRKAGDIEGKLRRAVVLRHYVYT